MKTNITSVSSAANRLYEEFQEHGNISVAFDFDNTIYDFHNTKLSHIIDCIDLLRKSVLLFDVTIWTCSDTDRHAFIVDYLTRRNVCHNFLINDQLDKYKELNNHSRKPFFSLLLDDRAGLEHSMRVLNSLINKINQQQ